MYKQLFSTVEIADYDVRTFLQSIGLQNCGYKIN